MSEQHIMKHQGLKQYQTLAILLFLIVIVWELAMTFLQWLNMPTVAKDIDGNCVYIEYADGVKHMGCGDSLPQPHYPITVAPFDKTGEKK